MKFAYAWLCLPMLAVLPGLAAAQTAATLGNTRISADEVKQIVSSNRELGERFAASADAVEPVLRGEIVRRALIEAALDGRDAQYFHRYYAAYDERVQAVLARAETVAQLRSSEPVTARAVDAFLASTGTREADVRVLLLRTREAWVAVLLDPRSARPLRMLRGEAIDD